jgi:hypothetical protein
MLPAEWEGGKISEEDYSENHSETSEISPRPNEAPYKPYDLSTSPAQHVVHPSIHDTSQECKL